MTTPPPSAAAQAAGTASSPPRGSSRQQAVIGPSIHIHGKLSGSEDLIIEGSVEGEVRLPENRVTIGAQGRVHADVHGKSLEVQGKVEGNLFGAEQVVVRSSGQVKGNITCPRVSLEDGASFRGAIDMESKAAAAKPVPLPEKAPAPAGGNRQGEQPRLRDGSPPAPAKGGGGAEPPA